MEGAYWMELSEGQRAIYMEFHAPTTNNVKQMPWNESFIHENLWTPTGSQINILEGSIEEIHHSFRYLTDGQTNALILWSTEEYDDMEDYEEPEESDAYMPPPDSDEEWNEEYSDW